jgi:hypothetical protein
MAVHFHQLPQRQQRMLFYAGLWTPAAGWRLSPGELQLWRRHFDAAAAADEARIEAGGSPQRFTLQHVLRMSAAASAAGLPSGGGEEDVALDRAQRR